ncbi:RHS repeat domain-containing protein [Candidatus Bacteroides intestinigallinarum]|uniref:RHS repeat domain-containing protein n=1 Tax=Candidatus Bacteroides intestinigallinarum TaxID=2838470 RepID=UPI002165AF4C|nr:RHS repeat-associated core domain-containing protein [Candidatus Bacteroides intestinigallinarum]MCS3201772.1 RHS repeat-associated core domain-containing protein [Candidatus Bacteroides intestinigallinarum]
MVYFDGLGRPSQTVDCGITPDRKDLVSLQEYDDQGRKLRTWLPAKSAGNGNYMPLSSLQDGASSLAGGDARPYLQTTYEASPFNRPVAQHGAGAAWAEHPVSYQYITRNPRSFPSSYYMTPSGNFLGVCTTDEDGNQAYEFKDGFGRTILAGCMDGPDPCFAYYEYDNHDDLVNVYPPFVTYYQMNEPEGPYATQSSYSYHYDFLHRCVYKKLPERDAIYYIYDHSDHQVFSQDGEQRVRGEWTFSLSDELNRPVLTGICHDYYSYNDFPLWNTDVKARRDDTGTAFHGYILENIPMTNPVVYTVNYYDDYSFIGKHGVPTSLNYVTPPSGYGTCYAESSKGLLTGTVTARMDATGVTGYDYAAFYYDERGRIIQSRATNHMGGIEEEYVAYNFMGEPLKRQHVHTATGKSTQTEECTYEYDHAGRLLTTKHKLNTNEEVTLVENTYDDLGRIRSSKRHGNSGLATDYTYNVRSWIKTLTTDTLFTQTLHYNDSYGGSTPCYNGNMSGMSWKAAGDTGVHGYRFSYDGLSRLTAAGYLWNGAPSANYNTSYTYNRQSNLTSLRRNGRTGASSYGLIDDLTFTLDGNWLTRVDDAATASAYNNGFEFKDAVKQGNEYTYDKNGNMTKDLNKNITDIQYNCLNSPCKVTFKDGSTITYTYALNGAKLRTVHKTGNTTSTTDYCGNVIYENGVQKLLLTDAGHVTLSDKKYHYYLQDHQGNNRVVVDQAGQKEEVNHYYPFGGTFASAEKSIQPYKYNGKELDTKNGLNWYDYGARQYDAAIGRWNAVDPMAEKYYNWSPYSYCMSNPIKYIDPSGQTVVIWYKNDSGKTVSYSYSGGNVAHPNPFVKSVITAYQYNKANGITAGNGGGASTVEIVENADIKVNVMETALEVTYSPDAARGVGCIYWKSDWGSQNENGTVTSPATDFDHEAAHALEHKTNAQEYEVNRIRGNDSQYDSKEERRVITGPEQRTARANGETRPGQMTRRNHKGRTVVTKGVTSNVIDIQKTKEYEKRKKPVWTSEP